jgi:hypothetical protein
MRECAGRVHESYFATQTNPNHNFVRRDTKAARSRSLRERDRPLQAEEVIRMSGE